MPLTATQVEALAAAVMALLGTEEDTETKDRAFHSVGLVTTLVRAYTRHVGFSDGEDGHLIIAEPLQAVIITATARLVVNPEQSASTSESNPVLATYGGGHPVMTGGTPPAPATDSGGIGIPGKQGINPVLGQQSASFSVGAFEFTPIEKAVLHQFRLRNG